VTNDNHQDIAGTHFGRASIYRAIGPSPKELHGLVLQLATLFEGLVGFLQGAQKGMCEALGRVDTLVRKGRPRTLHSFILSMSENASQGLLLVSWFPVCS
jgi:hypothetical protein